MSQRRWASTGRSNKPWRRETVAMGSGPGEKLAYSLAPLGSDGRPAGRPRQSDEQYGNLDRREVVVTKLDWTRWVAVAIAVIGAILNIATVVYSAGQISADMISVREQVREMKVKSEIMSTQFDRVTRLEVRVETLTLALDRLTNKLDNVNLSPSSK